MDFSWTEEQLKLKQQVIDFARKELVDDMITRDREGSLSRDLWNTCAGFGIQGFPFPARYGGLEADIMTCVLVMESLGYGCKDNGLIFAINAQMWSVQMPIMGFGSDEQKELYLPKLISGEWIGGHGMSEPGSGSDAYSMKTTARLDGEVYVLNGSKMFVTNAPVADVFVVFAVTDKRKGFLGISAFIVHRNTPGFTVSKNIGKMGLRTSPWAELSFEECRIPRSQLLGKEGNGASIFEDSMEWERSCILASHIGAMQRQLETCISYSKERKQFNTPIGRFQSVANKLVDMKVRLETARLILYKVAWTKMHRGQAPMDAAIAKLYLSQAWIQSSLDAIQIHGGYGYTTEYEIERDLRDSLGGTLYSGTSEIQRNIIARHLRMGG